MTAAANTLPTVAAEITPTVLAFETEFLDEQEIEQNVEAEPDTVIHIQGTDRKYPAVVIRRRQINGSSRKTIATISKFGKLAHLYDRYEEIIADYQSRNG